MDEARSKMINYLLKDGTLKNIAPNNFEQSILYIEQVLVYKYVLLYAKKYRWFNKEKYFLLFLKNNYSR